MKFRDLEISDKETVEKSLHFLYDKPCHISFASLFLWKSVYAYQIWSENGIVVIRFNLDGNSKHVSYFVPAFIDAPYDPYAMRCILDRLKDDAEENCTDISFHIPSMRFMPVMRSAFPEYGLHFDRSYSEYIYSRKELSELKGKKFLKKRTLVNQFTSRYEHTVSDIGPADFDDCLELYDTWRETQIETNTFSQAEAIAVKTAFMHYHDLGLVGKCVRVCGKMVAFNIGSYSSDDVFEEYFEKADLSFKGAFAFVNFQMACGLPESVLYINREEDLGLTRLREAKQLYHPVEIMPTYMFSKMTPVMIQVRNLWLASFSDRSAERVEQFLFSHFDEKYMAARYDDGTLVSMGHLVRFGTSAFLYALCTHPDYHDKGLLPDIVEELYGMSRREGLTEMMIPADRNLRKFFSEHPFADGHVFSGWKKMSFVADDGYDFGTGDPEKDFAMFCIEESDLDSISFRDGREEDSSFIAECVLSSVDRFEFGEEHPSEYAAFKAVCSMTDTLYSYRNTIIAECKGRRVGCIIAYPGEEYDKARTRTVEVLCRLSDAINPDTSDMETGSGEYYLDAMAIVPEFRGHGLGLTLMKKHMERGKGMGYSDFSLLASKSLPILIRYYEKLGFRTTEEMLLLGEKYEKMRYCQDMADIG